MEYRRLSRGFKLRVFGLVVLVVASVLVVVTASSPSVPEAAPVASAPDAGAAFAAAIRQGTPVEVADQRTETKRVFAQPDGQLNAELASMPVRVRSGAGWVPVNTTLTKSVDRSVHPQATVDDLSFSAGGDTPLVTFGKGDKTLSLSWPQKLPVPTLDGPTATYHEVFPGVDLMMQAAADGYNERLVVKNATAAKNPALKSIAFKLAAKGLTVSSDQSGRIEAVDAAGNIVFAAPTSTMWDARGPEVASAPVEATVKESTLLLRPAVAMLEDPGRHFPVVIDPDMRSWNQSMWAKVFSGYPDQSYVNGTNDGDAWAKVGYCNFSDCNGIKIARTYFQFDTTFLSGKIINDVHFDTSVVFGPRCNITSNHKLFLAGWGLSFDTNWNNMPAGHQVGADVQVPTNYPGCDGFKGVGFDLTPADVRAGTTTNYFLQAGNETNSDWWRKYDVPTTFLRVWYNTRPNPPYELKTDPPLPTPCKWCGGTPYVGDSSIRLMGRLSDPDGNDQLKAIWDIYGGPAVDHREPDIYQASGAFASTAVDLSGRNDQSVTWSLTPFDRADRGNSVSGPAFKVDQVGVDKPPVVTAPVYSEDNTWHGGVGVSDTFTFTANGVPDIDHYLYGWNEAPSTRVDADALGGKASVTLTPPGDGPRDLFVQSVDRAGHRSPMKTYHFYVRAGNGPLAQWSFDGSTKDSATLGFRDATLHGAPNYVQGSIGSALKFDGVDDYATAPVSASTAAGFTFAGWVNLTTKTQGWATMLSQNGATATAVRLGYTGTGSDKWALELKTSDSSAAGVTTVLSSEKAQTGAWTHLAGVYDSTAKKVRLYVNGDLAGTADWTSPWPASGEFALGRSASAGVGADYLGGAVDEVRTYDRVLSDSEVKSIVTLDNVAAGYWNLDEADGTTARNSAAGGEMAALHTGAAFTQQGAVNGALILDGTQGYASTAGPAVRTDQSFTVNAWVKPSKLGDMAAVSQDGVNASGLYLKQIGGSWVFGMNGSDAAGGTAAEARSASNTVQPGVWTHLSGVYSSTAKTLTLYVNGVQAGSATAAAVPWMANGAFVIGRGQYGAPTGFWSGAVDEVRAYSRPLGASEIQGIVAQNNVPAAAWALDGDAKDGSSRGLNGTVSGKVDWAPGQNINPDPKDLAANFTGADGAVSAPPAVDTTKSFSVTSWVKLGTKTAGTGTVASQSGSRSSSFILGYTGSAIDRWSFAISSADADGPPAVTVQSDQPVQTGVWTHLVASYNAATKEMQLYVNGSLAGSTTTSAVWNATGEFDIGRGKDRGAWTSQLTGAVDDVKVYPRALFSDEIRTMAGRELNLVHNWQLDESSGTNVADSTGDRPGSLTTGARLVPGRVGNAVSLDGKTGVVSTSGVELRSDDSFTVSAWVYLDRKSDTTSKFTAVSLDGVHTSKFRLGHVADDMSAFCFDGMSDDPNACGKWVFEMAGSDVDSPVVAKAAVSTLPAEINTWAFLTGVYDKQTGKTWLYVNGKRVGDGTLDTAWQASGGAELGRGKVAGAPAQFWPGRVDDVRLYSGVLDKDRILSLYAAYPALDETPPDLPVADTAYWKFDENTGTAVSDSSGRGHNATMKGGASWFGGRAGAGAWLDGTSGYAETAGAVLDTTKSFSATAWVVLTNTDTGNYVVLGQDGNRTSVFQLRYSGDSGKWSVVVPQADEDNPPVTTVVSNVTVTPSEWTHLGVVYDASAQEMKLYVNGALTTVQVGVTLGASAGPFTIGRGKWNGQNSGFFPQGIDDVRVFGKALSDGEIRRVVADVSEADAGQWHFDNGTAQDYSWRHNDATLSGGASIVAGGVMGNALQLDGTTGVATTSDGGVPMARSFTVSAWAKLARTDKVATVVSQDGTRMSGFVLQYRPQLNRWVFGAATQDKDAAPLNYTASFQVPEVNRWTALTGVYDAGAAQFRLYVDGQLGGVQNNVAPWPATRGLAIGRDLVSGSPAEFFPGMIDEVSTHYDVMPEDTIQRRASWPAPTTGQLGRYADGAGRRGAYPTTESAPGGYHFDQSLGMLVDDSQPNTRRLYSCYAGTDAFTSPDPACEGQTVGGPIGSVYTVQPTNIETVAVYRCNTGPDHFESLDAACEGATGEGILGYTLAYAPLVRYNSSTTIDHFTTAEGVRPGYTLEGSHGFVALNSPSGTQAITSCVTDTDQFVSTDALCEGKTVIGTTGRLWTAAPAGVAANPIYRCVSPVGESMISTLATCEGWTVDKLLGYALDHVPDVTPSFPAGARSAAALILPDKSTSTPARTAASPG
ncbi:LamG domain-containing protein [Amycolatopsis carbonis]|uniref:LamG domain-containing protein n=1 Tax=Amycolatopsis carbonis TaxID=715471 RepID=A0A9Y2IBZ7_9PSEU|nr:LamG domain-containing protein [Amycolatopsis sp. 2-15]WIX76952.1 LamG domain-containing protein [Amycolatopsis sp. 2-15]